VPNIYLLYSSSESSSNCTSNSLSASRTKL
jgi:hypothetical protein